MNISLISPSFYPATIYGGPIFSTYYLCREVAKLADREIFVTTTNANGTKKLDITLGIWQELYPNFKVKYHNDTKLNVFSVGLLWHMWSDIKKSDIVYTQYIFDISTPLALLYAKLLGKKVLLSPRGSLCVWCLAQGSRWKNLWIKSLLSPLAKDIVWHATSLMERADIIATFPNAAIEIIPNGVAYQRYQQYQVLSKEAYCQKFINRNIQADKIIVSIGRVHKKKGLSVAIDAIEKINRGDQNIILLIAGQDYGEKLKLQQQVTKLQLEKNIFFIGEIGGQEKIDFLANADLFILPSLNENFGNVYIESLAAGTPIVASTNTPWEAVEEADCGKWVEGSVDSVSKAILEMLSRDRETMRIHAKEFAKRYEWSSIAEDFSRLFENMVKVSQK